MIELIGRHLIPHTDLLAKIAGTVTSLQFLSGAFLLNDVRKKGSSIGFPAVPFIGGIVLSILSLKYGTILRDDAMIKVNLFGFAISVIYLIYFYWYTPNSNKMKLWFQIGLAGIFSFISILYCEYEDKDLIEFRFGMILTVILVFLVASPLFGLKDIIRNKSTENLPFPLIFSGVIVSTSWMLYGFSILNTVVVVQNAFLLILGLIQLSLFIIYPSGLKSTKKNQKNKKKPE